MLSFNLKKTEEQKGKGCSVLNNYEILKQMMRSVGNGMIKQNSSVLVVVS